MTTDWYKKENILNALALVAVGFGIVLRLAQYISNRSLWGDEAWLALNIIDRSYLELLQPLDNNQAAPAGFLWIQKLSVQLLGDSEYAHRLFPLIAGIVSVVAIYKLGQWAVSPLALPIAVALFACLKHPLYYATEAKPYSSDVMVSLLLSLLLIPLMGNTVLGKRQRLGVGIAGALAIWVSYPAVFVLAGLESVALVLAPAKKRLAMVTNRLPVYLMWIISFLASYLLVTARVMGDQGLQNAWRDEYPTSFFDLLWLLDALGRFFYHPLGFLNGMDVVAIGAFLLGCFVYFRRDRKKLLVLLAPVAVTLLAAYLHKYHFRARLVLFLAPFFILIIAGGVAFLLSRFKQNSVVGMVGVLVTALLLFPPLVQATTFIVYPQKKEELRPVLAYIRMNQQPGDQIYADQGAVLQFDYYAPKFGLTKADYLRGYRDLVKAKTFSIEQWNQFKQQSGQLRSGQRVWFVFSGLNDTEKERVQPRLDQVGEKIASYTQPGVSTYLYRLK